MLAGKTLFVINKGQMQSQHLTNGSAFQRKQQYQQADRKNNTLPLVASQDEVTRACEQD